MMPAQVSNQPGCSRSRRGDPTSAIDTQESYTTGSFPVDQFDSRQKPFVAIGIVPKDRDGNWDRSFVVVGWKVEANLRLGKMLTPSDHALKLLCGRKLFFVWSTAGQRGPAGHGGSLFGRTAFDEAPSLCAWMASGGSLAFERAALRLTKQVQQWTVELPNEQERQPDSRQ